MDRRARNIPPSGEINTVRHRLLAYLPSEGETSPVCARRDLPPGSLYTELGFGVEEVPTRAVARAAFRPPAILAVIMHLVEIWLGVLPRIEERHCRVFVLANRDGATELWREGGAYHLIKCVELRNHAFHSNGCGRLTDRA